MFLPIWWLSQLSVCYYDKTVIKTTYDRKSLFGFKVAEGGHIMVERYDIRQL